MCVPCGPVFGTNYQHWYQGPNEVTPTSYQYQPSRQGVRVALNVFWKTPDFTILKTSSRSLALESSITKEEEEEEAETEGSLQNQELNKTDIYLPHTSQKTQQKPSTQGDVHICRVSICVVLYYLPRVENCNPGQWNWQTSMHAKNYEKTIIIRPQKWLWILEMQFTMTMGLVSKEAILGEKILLESKK